MKTLVIKLAGTVEDSSLKKFGEFTFTAKAISSSNYNAGTCKLMLRCRKPVTLEISGNGYFTNENLTANLGTKLTVPDNVSTTVFFSNGNYTVTMSSKYDVNLFWLGKASGTEAEFVLSFDFSQFADMTALTDITIIGVPTVRGDLSTLQYLTNLRYLRLHNNSTRITGHISNLAGMTDLRETTFLWLPNVTGDTSSIAHLHPNNGGVLAELKKENSGITGSWPPA